MIGDEYRHDDSAICRVPSHSQNIPSVVFKISFRSGTDRYRDLISISFLLSFHFSCLPPLDFILYTCSRSFNFIRLQYRKQGRSFKMSGSVHDVVFWAVDLQSTGRGFDSRRPPHRRSATLGKSFTYMLSASEVTTV